MAGGGWQRNFRALDDIDRMEAAAMVLPSTGGVGHAEDTPESGKGRNSKSGKGGRGGKPCRPPHLRRGWAPENQDTAGPPSGTSPVHNHTFPGPGPRRVHGDPRNILLLRLLGNFRVQRRGPCVLPPWFPS